VWTVRAVGIDLGASAIWCVAAEDGEYAGGRVFAVDELDELRRWCGDAVVAIDAPGGPSEGHHVDDGTLSAKFRPARCAEVALGRAGYWVSWVTGAGPFAPWMEVGFEVWRALDDLAPREVFPYAVFRELAGGARLASKQTLAGRRARATVLPWLPEGADLWSHDGLDAAAACAVAGDPDARCVRCGDHEGGSPMWLPARRG
jgi:hypothetical protein